MYCEKEAAAVDLWRGKPYYSLDAMLRRRFGEKIYKITLNGGMSCPNRDGTLGRGGCIFCSSGGSGDFAANVSLPVREQIEQQIQSVRKKRPVRRFIAYFQAYTNTYAPVEYLEKTFREALRYPDIAGLSIGTRPDCLPKETLELLAALNAEKPVWIELGLQTIHERTARYIRRGYDLPCFENAVSRLHSRGLEIIVHTILGLPGESRQDMLETICYLNHLPIQGIKLQLLHILKGTDLAADYLAGKFAALSMEEYLDLVISCLEHLSPEIVVHRITGDGPKALLIAPLWSSRKREVLNALHHQMKLRNTRQGRYFSVYARNL